MEQFSTIFLSFIDTWGYVAVAVLMGLENACIPIPSELFLGFAGYLIFAGKMEFFYATVAGMIGGMVGSIITYYICAKGGRPFKGAVKVLRSSCLNSTGGHSVSPSLSCKAVSQAISSLPQLRTKASNKRSDTHS